jgi:hypothetical protein
MMERSGGDLDRLPNAGDVIIIGVIRTLNLLPFGRGRLSKELTTDFGIFLVCFVLGSVFIYELEAWMEQLKC